MSYQHTPAQRELFTRFRDLAAAVADDAADHDANGSFDSGNWRRLADAGLWRIPVPQGLGGDGGTWADCMAAIEGVARSCRDLGFLITVLGHVGCLRVMLEEGTTAQQERWLEAIMNGAVGVTAMTEATGGSDLARMRLSATRADKAYRLDGRKVHITNAPIAAHGMIAGRLPELGEKRDITLFFVDLPGPGISIGETEDNLGIRTSPTADIDFAAAPIDELNIVGRAGDGLRLLYGIIAFERALYGALASGLIEGMIDDVLDRVEDRQAFQRPLADYQHVQRRITDMKIGAVNSRLLAYAAMDSLEAAAPEASTLCSIAKFTAGEELAEAAQNLVQLHGHLGFMNNAISRQLRDSVGMRIAGGTSDIQRINIFNQIRRARTEARGSEATTAMAAE